MTAWEEAVVRRLCAVDGQALELAREALDHLVVTGGCGCGCGSFDLRDVRHPLPPLQLDHVANGLAEGIGFVLLLGPDGRPRSVEIILPDERSILQHGHPDPESIEAWPAP